MCGIVGYTGGRRASEIVYRGLEELEYRGYDSAGIASLENGNIYTVKRRGRVKSLDGLISDLDGNTAVGHTRWATHGKPSDKNAHPHVCGKFALVHNGIIENCEELKKMYFSGVEFDSETDSEVIVRLIDLFYDGDILSALKNTASLLKGSYAVALICADFDGLAVMKRNNPAIIGYGDGENFVASDAPALSRCKTITILKDGDIALVTKDGVNIFDENLQGVIRERIKNLAEPSSLELGDCPHYMLKEIREVPATVVNTCSAYLSAEQKIKEVLSGVNRIIITGCGTAYNAGLLGKRYVELIAGIPAEAEIAGEFRYKRPIVDSKTLVLAVSQSGETADTVEAAKLARSLGGKVIAVTNSPYSELVRLSDATAPVAAGPEICVAATKSYVGQVAALYLFANTLAGEPIEKCIGELEAVSPLCKKTIEHIEISSLADMCARSNGVYFLGRDTDYAVATEGSLKLKEISYIAGDGYPAGELKHGTLALIDIKTVSVFIITRKELAEKNVNAVEQVLSRRGKAAVVTNIESVCEKLRKRAEIIRIPECPENLSPLISVTVLQMLAYNTALLLERDPDKPRNLAKSVTVE